MSVKYRRPTLHRSNGCPHAAVTNLCPCHRQEWTLWALEKTEAHLSIS